MNYVFDTSNIKVEAALTVRKVKIAPLHSGIGQGNAIWYLGIAVDASDTGRGGVPRSRCPDKHRVLIIWERKHHTPSVGRATTTLSIHRKGEVVSFSEAGKCQTIHLFFCGTWRQRSLLIRRTVIKARASYLNLKEDKDNPSVCVCKKKKPKSAPWSEREVDNNAE